MEHQFDFNSALAAWRRELRKSRHFEDGDIDELESHLLDSFEAFTKSGMPTHEAFQKASEQLGSSHSISAQQFLVSGTSFTKSMRYRVGNHLFLLLPSYMKSAWRHMQRHSMYSGINMVGLSAGIACCLMIMLFVRDELRYDRFHPDADRVYRIAGTYKQGGDTPTSSAQTTYLLSLRIGDRYSNIESMVRFTPSTRLVALGDQAYEENNFLEADSTFFEVFQGFEFEQGSAKEALREVNSVVLTREMAEKYFPNANPLGHLLEIDGIAMKVSAVIENFPSQSHFRADFIANMASFAPGYADWIRKNPTGQSHYTYVKLASNADLGALSADLNQWIADNWADDQPPVYSLQPLTDIHLHSNLSYEIEANGSITYVYIFASIAVIILLIASINYVNLATARSIGRSREVGMRKVSGASKTQIAGQFLGESVLTSMFSLALGMVVVYAALPWFNQLSGKAIPSSLLVDPTLLTFAAAGSMAIGVLSGLYPALFVARFNSARVLKGNLPALGNRSIGLRKVLVIAQFGASAILLTGALTVNQQLSFLHSANLGLNPSQVVLVTLPNQEIREKAETIKQELLALPNVTDVSATNNNLTARVSHWRRYTVEGIPEPMLIPTMIVDHDFLNTLQGGLAEGRFFSRDYPGDLNGAYVINESGAKKLGLEKVVGTGLVGAVYNGSRWSQKDATIIGVVKDFHTASLHTEVQPTMFSLTTPQTTPLRSLAVRIEGHEISATMASIESVWKDHAGGRPISYRFMDEALYQAYLAEERVLNLVTVFSGLAILIAGLGILGLAAFTVGKRRKEIGIRKVLGASTLQIIGTFVRDFAVLVVAANVIAGPVSWLMANQWLSDFAYKIAFPWWSLIVGLVALLALAGGVAGFQSWKAATDNPVNSLNHE